MYEYGGPPGGSLPDGSLVIFRPTSIRRSLVPVEASTRRARVSAAGESVHGVRVGGPHRGNVDDRAPVPGSAVVHDTSAGDIDPERRGLVRRDDRCGPGSGYGFRVASELIDGQKGHLAWHQVHVRRWIRRQPWIPASAIHKRDGMGGLVQEGDARVAEEVARRRGHVRQRQRKGVLSCRLGDRFSQPQSQLSRPTASPNGWGFRRFGD